MKFVDEFLSLDLVRALLRHHPVEANLFTEDQRAGSFIFISKILAWVG